MTAPEPAHSLWRGSESDHSSGAAVELGRREAVAVALGVALVAAAFVVPHLRLGVVTPLIHSTRQIHDYADTAPISAGGESPCRLGRRRGRRHRYRRSALGPNPCAAVVMADPHTRHLGHVVRVGVFAGDDRRLAGRVRGASWSPPP